MKFWRPRSFDDLGKRSHVSFLSTVSKGLFSAGPISFKFRMQPPCKRGGGIKVYLFGSGHMTKMDAMPI